MRAFATVVITAATLVSAMGRAADAQVYRLRVTTRDCGPASCRLVTAYASAVAVGRYNPGKEILLTARHAVAGTLHRLEIDIDGTWRSAVVLAQADDGSDLALIGLSHDGKLPAVEIARQAPATGEALSLVGFPQGNGPRQRTARVHSGSSGELLTLTGPSTPGESGGGVLDADGRLAGVIFGTAPPAHPTSTLAVAPLAIHRLFRSAFGAAPPCHPTPSEPRPSLPPDAERVRLAQSVAELTRRLDRLERTPIPVEILAPDGRVLDRHEYPLGETIQLRLTPRGNDRKGSGFR
jgi:hypothetical protein